MSEDLRPFGNPGSEKFRLDAYPFYLLNRAASRYNVVIEAELRTVGIDIPTWRVLMILGEKAPLAIGQVAKSAVINLSTVMRIVERMAKADLLVSAPSEQDGRVTELELTDRGREVLAAARKVTAPLYDKIIKGFSAADFARMLDILARLHDNLN
ncbi:MULTISPECIES: MarR family winged helix-turn-helix transcriptional regulator [unclassified Novosphingobium]|uniref:MarR family winged helix-turn-helix transcriptional regulator n=1 Tax=Novosphingobium TaxID=165696 RepID=UPI001444F56B|nr:MULTISPECIES: MarR family transcriptional regulator [unclassified Novosphingobium]NKJ42389.1 DNA-binding MarR family transcriptional regulator [Novosphingobium sp. SG720]NMN04779.1 DNA-binding MarR family transcriptional regulator [Novosphingobium sp. SG919]NMN85227.1 DNA-binding MarR family transcriptional regulator [Novosphingobium sp. SG916]